ncbi:unnamed protein product [Symbiodinium microadriaticum]|nr:unnamed protein product [Symbiodinium microadriaticum]CAE7240130.1 unnamed protein product [Symbiodinium sp. KB8]
MKKQWLKPAQRRKQYSGSFQKPSRAASGHRHWRGPSSTGQTPESALQELIQAGYVQIPDLCPTCHYGALEGPFARKDVQQPGHLHVRCKDWDCRARFNVLHFCPLLENIGRPLSVTPQKLLALVVQYLSKSAPRLYEAVHFNGLHNRVVLQVNDELRRLEANEGRRLLHKIRLKGDVELDATALRKVHISSTNEGWAPLVEEWKRKHPRRVVPQVFQLHIRCAGALQRDGPVLVVPLPPKLVVPGARPPTESLEDVYDSNLVSKLARGETQAFSDGNKAWRRVCQEAGIPFEDVCTGSYSLILHTTLLSAANVERALASEWGDVLSVQANFDEAANDSLAEFLQQVQVVLDDMLLCIEGLSSRVMCLPLGPAEKLTLDTVFSDSRRGGLPWHALIAVAPQLGQMACGMHCGYLDVSVMSVCGAGQPVFEIGFRKARLLLLARALARRPHVVQTPHPCDRLVLLACRSVSHRPDVAETVLPWKFLLSLPRIGWTWDLAVLCMPIDMQSLLLDRDLQAALPPEVQMLLWSLEAFPWGRLSDAPVYYRERFGGVYAALMKQGKRG